MSLVKSFLVSIFILLTHSRAFGLVPADFAIPVTASVDPGGNCLVISWTADSRAIACSISRRPFGELYWVQTINLSPTAASYTDMAIAAGERFEYRLTRSYREEDGTSWSATSYIVGSFASPLVEQRGKVILLVESSLTLVLEEEIGQLMMDLVGDGWEVVRRDVAASTSVQEVRGVVKSAYQQDPSGTKALFILGRVPVPYSGNLAPDAHEDHRGAWPADVIYGDIDGVYRDTSVSSGSGRNHNQPGDGKFDESSIAPGDTGRRPELQVGRVDLSNLPSFSKSEIELVRAYLNKDHAYRYKKVAVEHRALVHDNFGLLDGWEPFAANGWRNFPPLVGSTNVNAEPFDTLRSRTYLWAYGCGGSSYTACGGIVSTGDLAANAYNGIFNMLYGSYFGDWDIADSVLRAPLASGQGLVSMWAGRPAWFTHAMGAGETIGYCTRLSQGNTGEYPFPGLNGLNGVHIALMGDPTLRLYPVGPCTGLQGTPTSNGGIALTWTASNDSVAGYHVYVAPSAWGPYTRVSSALVTGTSFTDSTSATGKTYMARAVKLETTPSGTFFNLSQGSFYTSTQEVPALNPDVTVTASQPNAAEWGPSAGTIRVSRNGTASTELKVNLKYSGTATNGYTVQTLPASVTFTAGTETLSLSVTPIAGHIPPTGAGLTVEALPNAAYDLGASHSGTVHIVSTPFNQWRAGHFTASELAEAAISGPDADPDGDGRSNMMEFGLSLDPWKMESLSNRSWLGVGWVNDIPYAELYYYRNKQALDVSYVPEVAPTPSGPWTSGPELTETVSVTDAGDGTELVLVRDRTPVGSVDAHFLRLRLIR